MLPPAGQPQSSISELIEGSGRTEADRTTGNQKAASTTLLAAPALICLSHLRWDFVFQRPQHLLTRFAKHQRVFYVEEPVYDAGAARMILHKRAEGVVVAVPHLPHGLDEEASHRAQRMLLDGLLAEQGVDRFLLWFYTPMALPFTHHLRPLMVVYDCMDELSAFAGAPPVMSAREAQLLAWADIVFTGGHSLYAAKRNQHPQVHAFPSSIDQHHFAQARSLSGDPADQAVIPHPRIGFYGVVDERFDIDLIAGAAKLRPDWHFVIIGPVVKIDPATLPRAANIHYLGKKEYRELPEYAADWDVAMLPFARNASTRFISPTKTPEYLCAGCPVVSTSIADVIKPYGEQGLVRIADTPADFIAAIEAARADGLDPRWLDRVDAFLDGNSWDRTWTAMRGLMVQAAEGKGQDGAAIVPAR